MNGPLPDNANSEKTNSLLTVAFTWSPANYLQKVNPQESYKLHTPVLRRLTQCCQSLQIYPECFVNGGLHYHGTLVINDKIKWYASVLPHIKHNGFVVIKPKPDNGWLKYISKDWDTMSAVLQLDKPLDLMTLKTKLRRDKKCNIHLVRPSTLEDFISVEPYLSDSDSIPVAQYDALTGRRLDMSKNNQIYNDIMRSRGNGDM